MPTHDTTEGSEAKLNPFPFGWDKQLAELHLRPVSLHDAPTPRTDMALRERTVLDHSTQNKHVLTQLGHTPPPQQGFEMEDGASSIYNINSVQMRECGWGKRHAIARCHSTASCHGTATMGGGYATVVVK